MTPVAYVDPLKIHTLAVIGLGSVGASWAALFLAQGLDVIAHDPGDGCEARARAFIDAAWPALNSLGLTAQATPPHRSLKFASTLANAVKAAEAIQENIPEKPELKSDVLKAIDAEASPDKLILSSTGGMTPSTLQWGLRRPERLVVMHPFNPSHLIPLVEVVGGDRTAPEAVAWAMAFAKRLGKHPIQLNSEMSGHMTNRLQFALVREVVACLMDGIASAADIDAAVRLGLAPRWALMGPMMTLHMAGGPGGMKGILDHAGAAIASWWKPAADVQMTWEVREALVLAAADLDSGRPVSEWALWRDEELVKVLGLQNAAQRSAPHRPAQP